jgi:hypothetical protein
MVPGSKGARLVLGSGLSSYLGNQKIRNEVANLPQQIQFGAGWNVFVFYFHPCRVAGLIKMFQLFRKSWGMAVVVFVNIISQCCSSLLLSSWVFVVVGEATSACAVEVELDRPQPTNVVPTRTAIANDDLLFILSVCSKTKGVTLFTPNSGTGMTVRNVLIPWYQHFLRGRKNPK